MQTTVTYIQIDDHLDSQFWCLWTTAADLLHRNHRTQNRILHQDYRFCYYDYSMTSGVLKYTNVPKISFTCQLLTF
jgi:hypothetical protein